MKASQLFFPTKKETPKDAQVLSHQLMIRAGLIRQQASGLYSWLPLGLRVLRKIEKIVRQEMDILGANEMLMPLLQKEELWKESGRLDAYGPELMRLSDRHEVPLLLSPTAEESFTDLFRAEIKSYKSLPQHWYQMHWKFRDEIRPRFGVMRSREFHMYDNYSFALDKEQATEEYKKMFLAFHRIFRKIGLSAVATMAPAGAIGGDLSHEFHVLCDTGESTIHIDKKALEDPKLSNFSYDNKEKLEAFFEKWTKEHFIMEDELYDEKAADAKLKSTLVSKKGVEVGHIFYFGTKYSKPMKATVKDKEGKPNPVHMGSYGLGLGRIVAAAVEVGHDEKGIAWPHNIAPFQVAVIPTNPKDEKNMELASAVYNFLLTKDVEVLLDDRPNRAGEKFADMDLIGIPFQLIVGKDSPETATFELVGRPTGEKMILKLSELEGIPKMLESLNLIEDLPDDFDSEKFVQEVQKVQAQHGGGIQQQNEMQEMQALLSDPETVARMKEALENPETPEEERQTLRHILAVAEMSKEVHGGMNPSDGETIEGEVIEEGDDWEIKV